MTRTSTNALGIASMLLFLILAVSVGVASESPTCDLGDIKSVSVQIDGVWQSRPDSRIDGLPRTYTVGPFPVIAILEEGSEIVEVELFYSDDGSNYDSVSMEITEDTTISGEIPILGYIPTSDTVMHFYLDGYDSERNIVWLDEIPYTCPPDVYTGGDPYNFIILATQPTIIIDDCDTGVVNQIVNGYPMSAIIAECENSAGNHGEFVSCVSHLTNEWKKEGLITDQEKGSIQSCAAEAVKQISLGDCILTMIKECSDLKGRERAECIQEQIGFCHDLFDVPSALYVPQVGVWNEGNIALNEDWDGWWWVNAGDDDILSPGDKTGWTDQAGWTGTPPGSGMGNFYYLSDLTADNITSGEFIDNGDRTATKHDFYTWSGGTLLLDGQSLWGQAEGTIYQASVSMTTDVTYYYKWDETSGDWVMTDSAADEHVWGTFFDYTDYLLDITNFAYGVPQEHYDGETFWGWYGQRNLIDLTVSVVP